MKTTPSSTTPLRDQGRSLSRIGSWIWVGAFLLGAAPGLLADSASSSSKLVPQVTFINSDEEREEMGRKIIAITAERFEKVTGRKIGRMPIRVEFVDSLGRGDASHGSSGRMQGVTVYEPGACAIQISMKRSSSFGRVLAHEVTHAFIREAFGRTFNRTLNEGLAEYMAAQQFSSEVRRDLRVAGMGGAYHYMYPYIEGHRFCSDYADEAQFPSFLAKEFYRSETSYGRLKDAWTQRYGEKD